LGSLSQGFAVGYFRLSLREGFHRGFAAVFVFRKLVDGCGMAEAKP